MHANQGAFDGGVLIALFGLATALSFLLHWFLELALRNGF